MFVRVHMCWRDCVNSSQCLWLIVFSACCDRERRRLDDVSADAGKRIAAAEHAQVEAKKAWLKDMALAEALIAELKAGVESERGAAVAANKEAVFAAEQVGRFCQTAQSLGHSCPGCAHSNEKTPRSVQRPCMGTDTMYEEICSFMDPIRPFLG